MRLRSHTVGAVSFWHEGVHHNCPGWWRIVSGELFTFVERWAGAAVSMGMEVEGKLGARLGAARVASLYNNVEEGISQGKMIFLRKNREKK